MAKKKENKKIPLGGIVCKDKVIVSEKCADITYDFCDRCDQVTAHSNGICNDCGTKGRI